MGPRGPVGPVGPAKHEQHSVRRGVGVDCEQRHGKHLHLLQNPFEFISNLLNDMYGDGNGKKISEHEPPLPYYII